MRVQQGPIGRRGAAAWLGVAGLALAAPLAAGDGRLEINQHCAATGCFPGDAAGLPVTIAEPGSYVLTGGLAASGTAIEIEADQVTLDLNGFVRTESRSYRTRWSPATPRARTGDPASS